MKKFITGAAAVALIVGGLAAVPIAAAQASVPSTTEQCIPADAWVEVIEHEAVTEEVQHPAETEEVTHEAEYRTEYHFAKYVRERSGQKKNGQVNWSVWGGWSKWSPEQHTSWEVTADPLGTPQLHASWTTGNGNNKIYFERQWQAQHDGTTRQVKTKDAWTETVTVREAWTETVTITEAWTERIEHDAVVCPPVIPEQPDPILGGEFRTLDPVCTVPLDGTGKILTEGRTSTTEYVFDEAAFEWVPGEPVWTDWATVAVEFVEHDECASVPDPNPEVPTPGDPVKPDPAKLAKSVEPQLAMTGGNEWAGLLFMGGLVLLGAGIGLVIVRARGRR